MQSRKVYLETAKALSDSGTAKVDIEVDKPISRIELLFGATKGATENQSDQILSHISKIELIDGADVLWSLTGLEAVALNCFEMGEKPYADMDLAASGTPQETVYINFGFELNDPIHYLNPEAFRNLQLKITSNLTAAAGTYVTNTLTVSIVLHIMEAGYGTYDGFLMAKEHYTWTTTAAGDETIDMPDDFSYRLMLVRSFETLVAPETDISNLKLTANSDQFIVFDIPSVDLKMYNVNEFGLFTESLKSKMQDTDTLLSSFSNLVEIDIHGGTVLQGYRAIVPTAEQITVTAYGQT